MTQLMAVTPRIVTDYTSKPKEEQEGLLDQIIRGNISRNLRSFLLDLFKDIPETFFDDLEKARMEALKGYADLQVALRNISTDDMVLPKIGKLYSPVVSSNFRFALRVLMTLVQLLIMSVQQTSAENLKISRNELDQLMADLRRMNAESDDMPDASAIARGTSDYESQLSEIVMGYNIGLLIVLVIVVAAIAKKTVKLPKGQVRQIEVLLRDWPQETMAQITVLGLQAKTGPGSFSLQGILPDLDDYDIVNEGLDDLPPN